MGTVPRVGLLLTTLALPLGAVLASHVLSERPVPPAPVGVRIGESPEGTDGSVGQPSTPPSPAAVVPLVVGERAEPSTSVPRPDLPTGPATSGSAAPETTSSSAPPDADPPDPAGADPKGKTRGRGTAPAHPTPSHGVTPGNNGAGG